MGTEQAGAQYLGAELRDPKGGEQPLCLEDATLSRATEKNTEGLSADTATEQQRLFQA